MFEDNYNKSHFTTAMVTGASSGIGEAICHDLAERGISLMISGRNVIKLNTVAEELRSKVDVRVFPGDLTSKDDRTMLVNNIHHYVPDLVVNNAGLAFYGNCLTYETSEQMKIFHVNAEALLELSLEGARAMVSANKKGVIMNLSSVAAYPVFPGLTVYSATKAFVNQFSKSFDEEMREYGIRVLTCCPGVVKTNFRERASGSNDTENFINEMSATFAAREIWKQIQSGQQLRVIDWRYRLLRSLLHLIPDSVTAKILHKRMNKWAGGRQIIER